MPDARTAAWNTFEVKFAKDLYRGLAPWTSVFPTEDRARIRRGKRRDPSLVQ